MNNELLNINTVRYLNRFAVFYVLLFKNLPLKKLEFTKQQKKSVITLVWEPVDGEDGEETQHQVITIFSTVNVQLSAGKFPGKFTASLMRPSK